MITDDDLRAIPGIQRIAWNNDRIREYFLPVRGDGLDIRDVRVCVRFGERHDTPFMVWLVMPQNMLYLEHIDTTEKFVQLHALLTGGAP